jgi:hypothetical protein
VATIRMHEHMISRWENLSAHLTRKRDEGGPAGGPLNSVLVNHLE